MCARGMRPTALHFVGHILDARCCCCSSDRPWGVALLHARQGSCLGSAEDIDLPMWENKRDRPNSMGESDDMNEHWPTS